MDRKNTKLVIQTCQGFVQRTKTYGHGYFTEFFTNTILHDTPQIQINVWTVRNSFPVNPDLILELL